MIREITTHKVNGCNEALKIEVLDEPGAGGACHEYLIVLPETSKPIDFAHAGNAVLIPFQNGPIVEAGVNGITQEALLAVVIDRLQSFQAGPYACFENGCALDFITAGLTWLQKRTSDRLARGVEGTHAK